MASESAQPIPHPPWADLVNECNEGIQSYSSTSRILGKRFLQAAVTDDVNAAVECLKFGSDKDAGDRADKTVLHYAAGAGSYGVVELLLREGANPNAQTRFGTRVLEEAEYWLGKEILFKRTYIRPEKFQACIDLLKVYGARRRSPDELDQSTKKRLRALEDQAELCGIGRLMMPWCQDIGEPVMLPAAGCVATVDAPTVDVMNSDEAIADGSTFAGVPAEESGSLSAFVVAVGDPILAGEAESDATVLSDDGEIHL